jgi:hypothetical protein
MLPHRPKALRAKLLGILAPCRLRQRVKHRISNRMSELVFEVTQEEDGGFFAECLSENIRIPTGPPPEPHRSTSYPR